jgi:hypothetical protein
MEIRVEVTCPTSTGPVTLRSIVVNALTRNQEVLVRIDAYSVTSDPQDAVAEEIWSTLSVAPGERLASDSTPMTPSSTGHAVHGGPGLHLRDYGLIRPAALIGEAVGSVIGAILFGALFTLILLKLHVKPLPAALIAQLLVLGLRMVGYEHDGVWEIDWLISLPSSILALLYLVRWARRRPEAKAMVNA